MTDPLDFTPDDLALIDPLVLPSIDDAPTVVPDADPESHDETDDSAGAEIEP